MLCTVVAYLDPCLFTWVSYPRVLIIEKVIQTSKHYILGSRVWVGFGLGCRWFARVDVRVCFRAGLFRLRCLLWGSIPALPVDLVS